MNLKNLNLVMAIICFFASHVLAQGEFFESGMSGVGIGFGYSNNEDASAFEGAFGYSVEGIFDFGIGFSRASSAEKILDYDLNMTSYNPYIGLHVLKQDKYYSPISLYWDFYYSKASFDSDLFSEYNVNAYGHLFGAGATFYGKIKGSPSFIFQPHIGLDYQYFTVTLEIEDTNESATEDNQAFSVNFGFSLIFSAYSKHAFFVTPNFTLDKDNTTFSINVGFVIPTESIDRTIHDPDMRHNRIIEKVQKQKDEPEESSSRIVDILLSDEKVLYLDIENVIENHFIIKLLPEIEMDTGDLYYVVRYILKNGEYIWDTIGIAKVLKIKNDKVALKANMYERDDEITTKDKLEYRINK